jgi:hypothetical protein
LAKNPIEEFIEHLPFFKEFQLQKDRNCYTLLGFLKNQGGRNYNLGRRTQCSCFCYYYRDNRNSKKAMVNVKENHISL